MTRKQNMPDFGGVPQILQQEDGGVSFRVKGSDGEITMTRYSVFPGIDLIYNDIHAGKSLSNLSGSSRNLLEIDHCRDGRMECRVGTDSFYLAPGDICIHRLGDALREETFPGKHYHGITIQIDLDNSPKCLACFLEDVDVEPEAIARKFKLAENFFFALRQLPSIEHIFSELYALPHSVRKGYFKVKILELFLFLSGLEPEENQLEQRHFSETQITLARNVCSYLTEHIDQRITAQELAEQFGVPVSRLNNSFQTVYGLSIAGYMRGQRMQSAAKLLRQTDRTVLDIAGQFGYENGSKFAKAFRAVMGVTPMQYRNSICHKK